MLSLSISESYRVMIPAVYIHVLSTMRLNFFSTALCRTIGQGGQIYILADSSLRPSARSASYHGPVSISVFGLEVVYVGADSNLSILILNHMFKIYLMPLQSG